MQALYLAQITDVVALGELLKTLGGYGLAAVLAFVVRFLWAEIKSKEKVIAARDDKIFNLLDKQNEILKHLEKR